MGRSTIIPSEESSGMPTRPERRRRAFRGYQLRRQPADREDRDRPSRPLRPAGPAPPDRPAAKSDQRQCRAGAADFLCRETVDCWESHHRVELMNRSAHRGFASSKNDKSRRACGTRRRGVRQCVLRQSTRWTRSRGLADSSVRAGRIPTGRTGRPLPCGVCHWPRGRSRGGRITGESRTRPSHLAALASLRDESHVIRVNAHALSRSAACTHERLCGRTVWDSYDPCSRSKIVNPACSKWWSAVNTS